MHSGVSLAHNIQDDRFDRMSYGLATLEQREYAHRKGAAEEPENADHHPALDKES